MKTRSPIGVMYREAGTHDWVAQAGMQPDTDNVSMGIGVTWSYDLATRLVNCIDATVTTPHRPAFTPLAFASCY